jgi:integrase
VPAARRKALELEATRAGLVPAVSESQGPRPRRSTIGAAIDSYLDFVETHRSPRTYLTYRPTLKLLRASYTKQYVDQVERADILKFITDCYRRNLGHRTVYDKLVVVLQFFKRQGKAKLIEASDWPDYVETIRPIYEPEEIATLLGHASANEAIFIKFLLASGFRDREVRHVTWRDIDFRNSLVRVTAKPLWHFQPKNWDERAVPLPTALIEQLEKLRKKRNALPAQLVFPNSKGRPDSYNHHFFLHKFRHTFATEHLRHGIDIRTLQAWMGHRDIKSTMVYLKGVQSKDALAKVNAGALARYVS